jgi:hypothetical protein
MPTGPKIKPDVRAPTESKKIQKAVADALVE